MSKALLVISSLPEDRAFADAAAKVAGLPTVYAANPAEGASLIERDEPRHIFVDASTEQHYQQVEDAIQRTVGLFSDKINANAMHFITPETIDRSKFLIQSPLFGHYVMRNFNDPAAAGEQYGHLLKAHSAERAFGLSGFLKPGTKIQTVKLQRATQKQDAVEAVKNFFLAAKFQNRMATVIANAVDELLMNAIFDAPVDDIGRSLYATTARTTEIQLTGRHAIEMQVGFDGRHAAVTAVDLFGSLDKVKLLSHISKIYTEEEYKVKTSAAGAGIGLATVFRSGGSFCFVSEAGVRTEVTVFFRRTDNFREFRDQFRFLSTQFYL